jgi:hypothetical protein
MHDLGKHFACSLASYAHCYFNDDDWLNIYLDSQYTKYIECCDARSADGDTLRGRIVSNTMPIIHLEHRRWKFENPGTRTRLATNMHVLTPAEMTMATSEIDMHTSFTWLGTGSFFPRSLSSRFLQQQSALPDEYMLTRAQSMTSDMFFSLWTNEYVEQVSGIGSHDFVRSHAEVWRFVLSPLRCRMTWSRSTLKEVRLVGREALV